MATVTAAILGIALLQSSRPMPDPVAIRAAIPLPDGLFLDGVGPPALALSRDGRTLAFVARGATGVQRLYVRKMDEATAKLVPESDTVEGPFFSPDGRWVAFAVGVSGITGAPPELRKYSLAQGDFYGVEPVPGAALQTSIQLRTGWFTEVTRLVAAGRR